MGAISGRRRCSAMALGLSVSLALMACGEGQDPSLLSPIPSGQDDRTPTLTVVLTSGHSGSQESAARGGNQETPELWVKIDQICFQGVDGDGQGRQCFLPDSPEEWRNVEDWETLVEDEEVPPGTAQMRFIITQAVIVVANDKAYATSAVDLTADPPVPGLEAEGVLQCPSCSQSGIKVIFPGGDPTISEGMNFLIAEFDVGESIGEERGNSGRWVMHPVIRGSLILKARLTVEVIGQGTVTISPPEIECPEACTANYAVDEEVTLTAGADDGWSFVGWSGDCSGTDATTVVLMDSNKSCSATFEQTGSAELISGMVGFAEGAQLPAACGGETLTTRRFLELFEPKLIRAPLGGGDTGFETTTDVVPIDDVTGRFEFMDLETSDPCLVTQSSCTYGFDWTNPITLGSDELNFFRIQVETVPPSTDGTVTVSPGSPASATYRILEVICDQD